MAVIFQCMALGQPSRDMNVEVEILAQGLIEEGAVVGFHCLNDFWGLSFQNGGKNILLSVQVRPEENKSQGPFLQTNFRVVFDSTLELTTQRSKNSSVKSNSMPEFF